MRAEENLKELLNLMKSYLNRIDFLKVDEMIKEIRKSRRVFIVGAGLNSFVAGIFATRLAHLGYVAYSTETLMPPIEEGDLLIAISGSGFTRPTVDYAKVAKEVGAKVVAITSFKDSELAKIADILVEIPGRIITEKYKKDYLERQIAGIVEPKASKVMNFEILCILLIDAIIDDLK